MYAFLELTDSDNKRLFCAEQTVCDCSIKPQPGGAQVQDTKHPAHKIPHIELIQVYISLVNR